MEKKINGEEKKNNPHQPTEPCSCNTPMESPSGLIVPGGSTQVNSKHSEEREVTDIILGQITLVVLSNLAVNQGFHFSFLRSRTVLFLGSNKEKCGKNSIILEGPEISPCHVSIRWQEGKFILQDEGSANGTFLEGKRLIPYTSCELKAVSTIRLGSLLLQYRLESPNFNQAPATSTETTPIVNESGKPSKATPAISSEGVVIAEFYLLSLDAPYALPRHCEIMSKNPVFMLGKSARCDYQVEFKEKYVEDEQAAIIYSTQDEMFSVKGLSKENAICVNDQRVKDMQHLCPGDIIRLGAASNAPRIRFTLTSEEEASREVLYLSQIMTTLVRGKTYLIGNDETCQIRASVPSISGVVARLKIPERGEQILVSKMENCRHKLTIDDSEIREHETRSLSLQQTIQIDNTFSLVHDHTGIVAARVPQEYVLSDFISVPQRDGVYLIGSAVQCNIRIQDIQLPELIGEVSVPLEGEYFVVKKYSGVTTSILIDGEPVPEGSIHETRYGINQILSVEDYLSIRNNHRSLPLPPAKNIWKHVVKACLIVLFISLMAIGVGLGGKKYWPKLKKLLSGSTQDKISQTKEQPTMISGTQQLMKQYQQNVAYIVLFNEQKKSSSGTGFILRQKDDKETNSYYVVTCKHVLEPWKYEDHTEENGKFRNAKGELLDTQYYIAVWMYGSRVLALENGKGKYLLQNSFTDAPNPKTLGKVRLYKAAKDIYETAANGRKRHQHKSNNDIAILELKPIDSSEEQKLEQAYQPWHLYDKPQLDVGEPVIVLGYSMGGERLVNKEGIAEPVSCEGKLTSSCQAPAPLEINVNQTHGASGGPIINHLGEIVGMVSFSDAEKLVYGIHSIVISQEFKR